MTKKVVKKKRKKQEGHKPYAVDKEKFQLILNDVGSGFVIEDACKKNGVSEMAYRNYLDRNPKKKPLHDQALFKKETLAYKSMDVGMVKDWKAAAWWLERTKPERFREKKDLNVTREIWIEDDL